MLVLLPLSCGRYIALFSFVAQSVIGLRLPFYVLLLAMPLAFLRCVWHFIRLALPLKTLALTLTFWSGISLVYSLGFTLLGLLSWVAFGVMRALVSCMPWTSACLGG